VDLLYGLSARSISFGRATFYTTSLTHLALLGWYPRDASLQHHGVQLTLLDASSSITTADGPPRARVLTMEMMSEGLLWTLRDRELRPEDVHSTQAYEFDRIPPEVVADYVLDQRGTTYRDANCQGYAQNLMDRIITHGRALKAKGEPLISSRPELTRRLVVILVVVALAVVISAVAQWAICWRALAHARAIPSALKRRPVQGLRLIASKLAEDVFALEERAAKACGSEHAAALVRRAAIAALMCQSPFVFWYVVISWWQQRQRRPMPVEPLLGRQ